MAYLRDRRAFGNIGTRRFRGARFGDPLSPRFTGLLDQYGGAAAAYSLRALSSGWLAGDVVEVRRSSDSTTQDFTASQITGGQMLNFVNNGTTSLYNSARYFNGSSTIVTTAATTLIGDFTISATIVGSNLSSGVQQILGDLNPSRFYISSGVIIVRINSTNYNFTTAGISFSNGVKYDVTITRSGTNLTMTADDGTTLQSETIGSVNTSNFVVNSIGNRPSQSNFFYGIIYTVNLNSQVAYTGLGTSVTAWEDTIGSNDGTESNGAAYTGQPFDGFVSTRYDQSGATLRDATQATTTEQIKIVDAGAVVLDGNGNVSTLWDGVDDDLDVLAGFAGLTAANVYAVTDNAGVVTIDTLTAQDISSATNWTTILSSLTYQKVTALLIYPDATDQAGIESALSDLFE